MADEAHVHALLEATDSIEDVRSRVNSISMRQLPSGAVEFQITTLELLPLTVELSVEGYFTIVSGGSPGGASGETFDSLHGLLLNVSTGYAQGFLGSLASALSRVAEQRSSEDEPTSDAVGGDCPQ
eukprot:RCo008502